MYLAAVFRWLRMFPPLLLASALAAQEPLDESWLEDDSEQRAMEVNEGELTFITPQEAGQAHHHHNIITLRRHSLENGWVELEQCHRHLDRVAASQVVFHQQRIRRLRVTLYRNIARAWVEGNTVQLSQVGADAELCLHAETRALHRQADGSYLLSNGPYMRRFLDGYYPLHLSIEVRYADSGLRYDSIEPAPQAGFPLQRQPGRLLLDTWFEGMLYTHIRFIPLSRQGR